METLFPCPPFLLFVRSVFFHVLRGTYAPIGVGQIIIIIIMAAPRGGTQRHLEEGRALRAASAPSQQDQLRRSRISSVAAAEAGDGSVPRP